jgi:hypothetical protein
MALYRGGNGFGESLTHQRNPILNTDDVRRHHAPVMQPSMAGSDTIRIGPFDPQLPSIYE